MKKIIPILSLCCAVVILFVALAAIVCMSIAVAAPNVGLVAVPTAIVGLTASAASAPLAYLFKKDVLCKIAFFLDLPAAVISLAAILVWLIAL